MKTIIVAVATIMLAQTSLAAEPANASGRLSGTELVKQWIGPPKHQRTQTELYALQFVDGYLAGVADSTEGTVWCNRRRFKAHEIDAEIVWAMKDMPAQQIESVVAAKLIVQLLAKRYPCGEVAK